jgi:pimeloyl-ACP methyl ester carboxylesterase
LPEKKGDGSFWTIDLFLKELENLLEHLGITGEYDLNGHSAGGVLAAEWAVRSPKGLRRLVLSSTPASSKCLLSIRL